MSLSKKEVFSLISFDFIGLTQKMGEFHSEEEALDYAEQLHIQNNSRYNYMIVSPVSMN